MREASSEIERGRAHFPDKHDHPRIPGQREGN